MCSLTTARRRLNAILRPLNIRIDTLTAEVAESARILDAERRGQFDDAQFPVGDRFRSSMVVEIASDVRSYSETYQSWLDPAANIAGFSIINEYFGSPDAEVLYAMMRRLKPRRVIEVGSGNSTRVIRLAITDGGFPSEVVSIDPVPRSDVGRVADRILRQRVETLAPADLAGQLGSGDVLFIDSSHEVKTGGDVPFLYLQVLPRLRSGVVVHIHDIFLPFEYPREWIIDNGWRMNEQYLVAGIVMHDPAIEVLWAGHYLQRTRSELLPQFGRGRASSLWIRCGGARA